MESRNPATAKTNDAILDSSGTADSRDSVCQMFADTPMTIGTTPRKPKNVKATAANFLNDLTPEITRTSPVLCFNCSGKFIEYLNLLQKGVILIT